MKKILAVLFSILMLTLPASAAGFTDMAGEESATAVEVLAGLGILTGKTETEFAPGDTLTRAELVTLVTRLYGVTDAPGATKIFTDVPATHWAAGNIAMAYRMGIVNGVGNGQFQPEEPVKFTEAVKMLVCVLGYQAHADAQGGYPTGYMAKASQLDILKNVPTETEIKRGSAAMLIYNALEAPVTEKANYGTDSGTYTVGGKTLLDFMGVKTEKGQITATFFGALDASAPKLSENEIAIGSTVFADAEMTHYENLGKKVCVYYKENNGENQVLAVEDLSKETQVVKATDISAKTTASVFWYEEDGKERNVSISNATVVYNGSVAARIPENLCPVMGTVTLISNGADVDVILVDAFTNYVVSSTSSAQNKVFFMGGQEPLALEEHGVNMVFTDNDDKMPVTTQGLMEWDIVSVAKSTDGKKVRAIRSVKTVEGTVSELSEKEAVINGKTYTIAPNMQSQGLDMPTVGMNAVFHLDYLGNIAAVDTAGVRGYKYGFLAAAEMTKGLDGAPKLKIFTEDGEMKLYETAEKVDTIAGMIPASTLLTDETGLLEGGAVKRQMVRFEETADGKIKEILTASDYVKDFDNPKRMEEFSKDYYIDENRQAMGDTYWEAYFVGGNLRSFGGRFLMRSSTKILIIPGADAKDEQYRIMNPVKLTHGNDGERYTNLSFFDVDEDFVVGAMMWDVSATGVNDFVKGGGNAIVTGLSMGLDEDGTPVRRVNVLTSAGEEAAVIAEDDFSCLMGVASTTKDDPYAPFLENGDRNKYAVMPVSALKPGDVIRYETEKGSMRATTIIVHYRAETPGGVEFLADQGNLYRTTKEYVYRGGSLIADAKILRNGREGLVCQTQIVDNKIKPFATPQYATRVFPFVGQLIEFDLQKGTYKKISSGDFAAQEDITAVWSGNNQQFLIRYVGR